jgi:hypothetical protein
MYVGNRDDDYCAHSFLDGLNDVRLNDRPVFGACKNLRQRVKMVGKLSPRIQCRALRRSSLNFLFLRRL